MCLGTLAYIATRDFSTVLTISVSFYSKIKDSGGVLKTPLTSNVYEIIILTPDVFEMIEIPLKNN